MFVSYVISDQLEHFLCSYTNILYQQKFHQTGMENLIFTLTYRNYVPKTKINCFEFLDYFRFILGDYLFMIKAV